MTNKFTPNELCVLLDLLVDDIQAAIEYSCPVYYRNAANILSNPSNKKAHYFTQYWEADGPLLASKLSTMNAYDCQRLTQALINYWKPYYQHSIEQIPYEWAENELWNW